MTTPRPCAYIRSYADLQRKFSYYQYGPGTRLQIRDLSNELKVSPTPVREALARLASEGFIEYVAFVIDVFARRIVGWRVSRTATAGFFLDALEQAVNQRQPASGLTHHSDRGSQYLSIRYTERLAEAGIEPSVGSVGDSYDNALAETINGLFKAEVIRNSSQL